MGRLRVAHIWGGLDFDSVLYYVMTPSKKGVFMKNRIITSVLPVFALIAILGVAPVVDAQGKPSATIEISQWKAGFIIGVGGGGGKMNFKGKSYPLSIGGLRVGATVGVATADLIGNVFNLNKPEDIEGIYTAGQAAIAVAGGVKVWELTNSKGVRMQLRGKQIGLEIAVDFGGMSVKLK